MEKVERLRKNILFIMQLPPPIHGASIMNRTIKNCKVLNQNFICEYVNLATSKEISVNGKRELRKYFSTIRILYCINRHLISNKINLGYITLSPFGIGFIKDSLAVLLLKLYNTQIIIHLHGKGFRNYYHRSNWFLRKYQEFIFKDSYVIHLSPLLVNDVPILKDIKKRFVVPNGIEEVDFKNDGAIVADGKYFEILYLSNLIEEKGLLVALKAIKLVCKNNNNVRLKIIGKFNDVLFETKCKFYINSNNLNQHVIFLGAKYGKEKNYEFINSEIFIFPTYYKNEAFPLVILEAMQFGLPVITTFEGGIPDLVEDGKTGYLTQKMDPVELAEKIEILIKDKELRKNMGDFGKRKFNEMYTEKCFENNLLNVFNEII